jgi:hypothetical protein
VNDAFTLTWYNKGMVAAVSANLPPIPAPLAAPGGSAAPAVTTTVTPQSSVPVRLTVTQLVSGETIVTAQRADGSDCSTCLTSNDIAPIPGDPQGTVDKLQKALTEGEQSGVPTGQNLALLAQAHAALTTAQARLEQAGQGSGSGVGNGEESSDLTPDGDDGAVPANIGTHTPQGVNSRSVSLFA